MNRSDQSRLAAGAPCAVPILGLVLTGAASSGASAQTSVLLLAYAAGAATSLACALLIGGRVFAAMKRSLGGDCTVDGDRAMSAAPGGRIAYRFQARDLHLVLGPSARSKNVRLRVLVDGKPPGEDQSGGLRLCTHRTWRPRKSGPKPAFPKTRQRCSTHHKTSDAKSASRERSPRARVTWPLCGQPLKRSTA
ncbi:hypothetical protein BH09PSE5_BH09PSE5_31270 [soil metagenome]